MCKCFTHPFLYSDTNQHVVSNFTEQCAREECKDQVYIYLALPVLEVGTFLLGAIFGALIHSGYKRRQGKKKSSASLSGYEEVGLAQERGQTINLRDNEAYEIHAPQNH